MTISPPHKNTPLTESILFLWNLYFSSLSFLFFFSVLFSLNLPGRSLYSSLVKRPRRTWEGLRSDNSRICLGSRVSILVKAASKLTQSIKLWKPWNKCATIWRVLVDHIRLTVPLSRYGAKMQLSATATKHLNNIGSWRLQGHGVVLWTY